MKNIIVIGVIIAIIAALPITVFSDDKESAIVGNLTDSSNVSDEIRQILGVHRYNKVIKLYVVDLNTEFAKNNDIDEVFANNGVLEELYLIVFPNRSLDLKRIINDNKVDDLINFKGLGDESPLIEFFEHNALNKIAPDIKIYATYFLYGADALESSAVYYKTNKGDYVYYRHYSMVDDDNLFTIEEFCEKQRIIYQEAWENDPYNHKHTNDYTLVNILIIIGAVIIIAIGGFIGIRVKKKKRKNTD